MVQRSQHREERGTIEKTFSPLESVFDCVFVCGGGTVCAFLVHFGCVWEARILVVLAEYFSHVNVKRINTKTK